MWGCCTGGVYRSFTYGNVDFFILDLRFQRADNPSTNIIERWGEMLGSKTCSTFATVASVLASGFTTIAAARAKNLWPVDPTVNVPICIESGIEELESVSTDGSGGSYILWRSERKGGIAIRVQHVMVNGRLAWPTNGVPTANIDRGPFDGQLVPDGSGGVIATWADQGSEYTAIRAQHLDMRGRMLWNPNGVLVDSTAYWYHAFHCASDGHGGIFVVCTDVRDDPWGPATLYAQWIDSAGHARWGVGGVPFCSAVSFKRLMGVVADGHGGFIALWEDERARDWHYLLYAQRMDASGNALWQSDGILVSDLLSEDRDPALVSDGAGGAIAAWSSLGPGILAQHIDASGTMTWGDPGVDVTAGSWTTKDPEAMSDGAGGAIFSWVDARAGWWTPYVQHVTAAGATTWAAGGVLATTTPGGELARIASDGQGGVLACWYSIDAHIWAQRVTRDGHLATGWPAEGVAISTAAGGQVYPRIVAAPAGAILAWADFRNNGLADIYAQRIGISGVLGGGAAPVERVDPSMQIASAGDDRATLEMQVYGGSHCTIDYHLPRSAPASLRVFDVSGTLVSTIFTEEQDGGEHHLTWEPARTASRHPTRGVYTFVLEAAGHRRVARAVVINSR